MPMSPTEHALQWWGDDSYPKGRDWDALIAQFAKCRDEARVEGFDAAMDAALSLCEAHGDEALAAALRALRDTGEMPT